MSGRQTHQERCFTRRDIPDPMPDNCTVEIESIDRFAGNSLQLVLGHAGVGLVFDPGNKTAFLPLPDDAPEVQDSP